MPRIPYPNVGEIEDAEILEILDRARRNGTPRPESQAIRAHVPAALKSFSAAWEGTFVNGVVDHELKELCRVYVTKTVACGYCAAQRSVDAAVDEDHYADLLEFKTSDRYTAREKAALAYTDAVVWNADFADDELWQQLNDLFSPEELVEIGFFVALSSGQQRWLKTLDIGHREVLADTDAGLMSRSDPSSP